MWKTVDFSYCYIPFFLNFSPTKFASTCNLLSSMASTSRPNRCTHTITYDVFLSFRGKDTHYTFTDHLYKALLRAGLHTFRDDDAIPRGEVLKPEIETVIIESKASIVVLSQNYANSTWCLNELWLILEQRRKCGCVTCGQFVLPVFYHADPSDVRIQTGSFAIQESKETNVRRRKAALTEVANLTGKVLSGYMVSLPIHVCNSRLRKLLY
ncbi:hypothetical protein L1987_87530 [Smallanthus sonchifolius]|nr:hypothetical protein L1987_87530 [Smallanthus sonchifolius]